MEQGSPQNKACRKPINVARTSHNILNNFRDLPLCISEFGIGQKETIDLTVNLQVFAPEKNGEGFPKTETCL